MRQLDVQNAFLHDHLEKEVYMQQVLGYEDRKQPDHLVSLIKFSMG